MYRTMVVNCLVLLGALASLGVSALPIKGNVNHLRVSATDDLWNSVAAGDVAGTRAALTNGADINENDKVWDYKGSPLSLAAHLGYADVAVALITEGASVHARENDWEGRPLHRAAEAGQVDVSKVLIAAGADVNARDVWMRTPLFLAAESDRAKVAMTLIAAGADVNARRDDESTALHAAARKDSLYSAKMLVSNGADVNARDKDGKTPVNVADENTATRDYLRSVGGIA